MPTITRKTFDRKLFVATLQNVLETPVDKIPQLTLLNTVAHKKAKKMIEQVDTYF